MPSLPTISYQEVKNMSAVWSKTHNGGVLLILDDVHIRFATDVANLVLKNFVAQCAEQVDAKKQAATKGGAAPAEAPTEVSKVKPKGRIILTD
jgi:hypothetical protein